MNAKLSRHMTLLGLCAMAFYGLMLATGTFSLELMPQFVVSAVIFLSSGRLMKQAARHLARNEDEEEKPRRQGLEADWPWLTGLLNWTAALMILGVMAILLLKPIGLSFTEALETTRDPEHYFSTAVP